MPRLRARVRVAALALVAMAALARAHAQNPVSTGFTLVEGLGLPAVDLDALSGQPHAINTVRTRRAAALETAIASTARIGPSGAAYAPGRVLVKFRGGPAATVTAASLRTTSATATLSTRPDYADFDIVRIDPGEDPQRKRRFPSGERWVRLGLPEPSGRIRVRARGCQGVLTASLDAFRN